MEMAKLSDPKLVRQSLQHETYPDVARLKGPASRNGAVQPDSTSRYDNYESADTRGAQTRSAPSLANSAVHVVEQHLERIGFMPPMKSSLTARIEIGKDACRPGVKVL